MAKWEFQRYKLHDSKFFVRASVWVMSTVKPFIFELFQLHKCIRIWHNFVAQAFINLWPRTKHALDAPRRVLRRCFSNKLTSAYCCCHPTFRALPFISHHLYFCRTSAPLSSQPCRHWACAGLSVTGLCSRQLTRVFSALCTPTCRFYTDRCCCRL